MMAAFDPADLAAATPGLRALRVPALIVWGTAEESNFAASSGRISCVDDPGRAGRHRGGRREAAFPRNVLAISSRTCGSSGAADRAADWGRDVGRASVPEHFLGEPLPTARDAVLEAHRGGVP